MMQQLNKRRVSNYWMNIIFKNPHFPAETMRNMISVYVPPTV